jgi:type IV pilus assembly protein PilC
MGDHEIIDASLVSEDVRRIVDLSRIDDLFLICDPNQATTLGLLAQSQAANVDASPFLEAFARELSKSKRRGVLAIASCLREGQSTIEAIESAHGYFPPSVVFALKVANQAGRLDELFGEIANRPIYVPSESKLTDLAPFQRVAWALWQGCFLLSTMTFIMLFIIPQFEEMFTEFGLELPTVTICLMLVAAYFCHYWFIFFGLFAFLMIFYGFPLRHRLIQRLSSTRWQQLKHPPIVQSKLNLAWLSDYGLDFADNLKQVAGYHPNKRIASRIEKASKRTEDGQSLWKALGIEGVLSNKESLALDTASSSNTRSWLLRQMAFAQSRKVQSWSATRSRLFTALINTFFGLLVLLFCVGIFTPLIHIIKAL